MLTSVHVKLLMPATAKRTPLHQSEAQVGSSIKAGRMPEKRKGKKGLRRLHP